VTDGNSSFACGSLSESEAWAMILDPENHIANFKHNPNDSSDNLGDKKARTKEAHHKWRFSRRTVIITKEEL
jgi:hypothetical protein